LEHSGASIEIIGPKAGLARLTAIAACSRSVGALALAPLQLKQFVGDGREGVRLLLRSRRELGETFFVG
jgi:hypothetical protein